MVTFTGVTENDPLLQIVAVIALMTGTGLTVTVTVNGAPAIPPLSGVIVYIPVTGALVLFMSVPLMFAAPVPAIPPEKPAPAGANHE